MSEPIMPKGLSVRRITFWIMSTVAALVLLFSYRTSTGGSVPATLPAAAAAPGIVSAPAAGPSATSPATIANGIVAQTRWGPVQVRVTISGSRITDVTPLQYPQGNSRDAEINSYALPVLHDAVIAAQSARIDAVSGATVTSDGYLTSLQAALDTLHFG
ncbi:MAG TPA: FMN-binding protein [Mycobacteriales bacterium]